jgi:hypothetical protein
MLAGDLCDRQSHLQPAAHCGHSKSFSDLIRAAQFVATTRANLPR